MPSLDSLEDLMQDELKGDLWRGEAAISHRNEASPGTKRYDATSQPVVKVRLHSTGDASPLHPNAAAALGTPGWLRCSSLKYCPILPPHRANYARWGPRFSVVAPCHRGASPASVRRRDFHHGLRTVCFVP